MDAEISFERGGRGSEFGVISCSENTNKLFLFGLPALLYMPFVHFSKMRLISTGEWVLLVFLGVNTLIAYGALAMALKYLEANKISVIITLNPIITFIIMAYLGFIGVTWIQHEKFNLIIFAGAAIVLLGAILTVISRKKGRQKQKKD